MAEENKDKIVSFRMTEGEFKEVANRAKQEGRSLSEHIRKKVTKPEPPALVYTPVLGTNTYSTTAAHNVIVTYNLSE